MDKVKLNEQQIKELVDFIKAKRFFDPAVIVEILDHLACKVEEILTAVPGMDFNEAVRTAHHSFGIRGFRPIEEAYEKEIQQKYNRLYWRRMKELLISPKYLPLVVLSGLLMYKLFVWSAFHNMQWLTWGDLYFFLFILCFAGVQLYYFRFFRKEGFYKSKVSAFRSGKASAFWTGSNFWWWGWLLGPHHSHISGSPVYFCAAFYGLITAYSVLAFMAEVYTTRIAFHQYLESRQYINCFKAEPAG